MDVTRLTVVTILQYMHILNHYVVHLKLTPCSMSIIFQLKGGGKKRKKHTSGILSISAMCCLFSQTHGKSSKNLLPPPTTPDVFLIPHHSSVLSCFLFQHPFWEDSKICSEAFQVAVWTARSKPYFSNNDGKMLQDVLGAVLRCYRGALASVRSAKEVRISKCFLRAI